MKPGELVLMASLGLSPGEATAELARLEPALINLQYLYPVASGLTKATTLNVRALPDTNAPALGKLAQDTAVRIWGQTADGQWLVAESMDGPALAGWVSAEWVAVQP